jgi:large subunit ribosomal protein L29
MMKPSQIRELAPEEMQARIAELQEELFRLKFRGATETLDDPLRLRVIRRDIARLQTVLHEENTKKTKAGAARAGGR